MMSVLVGWPYLPELTSMPAPRLKIPSVVLVEPVVVALVVGALVGLVVVLVPDVPVPGAVSPVVSMALVVELISVAPAPCDRARPKPAMAAAISLLCICLPSFLQLNRK